MAGITKVRWSIKLQQTFLLADIFLIKIYMLGYAVLSRPTSRNLHLATNLLQPVMLPRMTPAAAVHRKSHRHMTGSAIHSVQIFLLIKLHCPHLFNIENIRMTVGAVKPLDMFHMGKTD